MKFKITFRLDKEEFYTTDSYEFEKETWEEILKEILSVENSGNTVLELMRIMQ